MVVILAVWVSKCCFLSFFSEINTIFIITGSILGYIVKILVSSFIETMDFELKLPLSDNPVEKENLSSKNTQDCIRLFKDNGEGSSKNPKSTKNEIGWEDYSYHTESESESESTHPTNQSSKTTGDGVETFKQKVGNITTKEEVSSTKKEVASALEQYESSGTNVPAFKEQVSALKEKLKICDNKLSELENKEKTEGKGKGKELLENNFSPRRVLNPNYQPAPRGLRQHADYSYDSDEEEEAVRRAIEESLKSNSSKEESSSKGKGKEE